jgi:hypothetical protein
MGAPVSRARIADHVAHLLIAEGMKSACWGDGIMAEAAQDHDPGLRRHPMDGIAAACAICERATDLFRKTRIHGHDSNGNPRVVRCFWLIGTPRPLPDARS